MKAAAISPFRGSILAPLLLVGVGEVFVEVLELEVEELLDEEPEVFEVEVVVLAVSEVVEEVEPERVVVVLDVGVELELSVDDGGPEPAIQIVLRSEGAGAKNSSLEGLLQLRVPPTSQQAQLSPDCQTMSGCPVSPG